MNRRTRLSLPHSVRCRIAKRGDHRFELGPTLGTMLIVTFAIGGFFCSGIAHASTGIEPYLSFEGKVVTSSGQNIADGTYNMEFRVYTGCTNNTGTGCSVTWTEDWLNTGTNTGGVTFSSGTFQINLGSLCPFNGGSCTPSGAAGGNTNTAINWNTYPLYISMQVGNNQACTNSNNNFTTNCTGDGVMSPYILLTATPYALNSNLLGGLGASAFGQLASSQTWTAANTFQNTVTLQPTTNVSSLIVEQNSSGSFGQDVFDVQGSSGGTNNFIQVSSTAANAGAVTVQSLGSNALGLQSGGTLNVDTNNVANTIQVGNTANAVAQIINIGNNTTASSTDTITVGSLVGTSATTIQGGTSSSSAISLSTGVGGGATVSSAQPASASGNGTNASTVLTVSGAAGGNTSGTSGQLAGTGGGISLQAGNGGTAGSGSTNGAGGNITLSAGAAGAGAGSSGAAGSVIVKNQSNSTTAFQVQNSVGSPLFVVDTTDTTNLLSYPGFEVVSGGVPTGWAKVGSPTTFIQNTNKSFVYHGLGSLEIVTTTSGQGATTSSFTTAPISGSTNTVSFYAMMGSGTLAANNLTVTSTDGTTHTCIGSASTTLNANGFQRVSCTLPALTGTMSALSITQTNAAAETIYIDAVQLQNGGSVSPYNLGGIQLRGIIENPLTLESYSNSTAAFQIQTANASQQLFLADSLNNQIIIGNGTTGDTTGVLLVLDTKTNAGDPTEVNGATYYNSSLKQFRCGVNGVWVDCVNGQAYELASDLGGAASTYTVSSTKTLIAPLYIPGQITINDFYISVTTALGATGDVGLYNSSGTLVLDGGSGSVPSGTTGLETIAPTQTGSARIIEAGQYYLALCVNSSTGAVSAANYGAAGLYRYGGYTSTGGSALAGSITLSGITTQATIVEIGVSN
ncbi:MAG TPA: hypothetical protein VGS08_04290 [Candidatus Saccharimonadales bacterium]|nr:hypothetical protein [Candidatus Saccharimonadales bacterium]